MDEFDRIARLFRPLTGGAPEALDLLDDAAVIPSRPGFDLVVTKDALVEGVHFLPGDPPDLVARKLLRVNLSDLAAKAAEPYAYFLAVAWSATWDERARARFPEGLAQDQARFGLKLFGGDTVSTPGPFAASVTLMGWVPAGGMLKRSGARADDVVLVSGAIGDGGLGLDAARGGLTGLPQDDLDYLAARYRLPEPRLELREALRRHASAATDVSDGLLADAGHIAEASGAGLELRLDDLPLSSAVQRWLEGQPDRAGALLRLASSGDDYEVVCTAAREQVPALQEAAGQAGIALTVIGSITEQPSLKVTYRGEPVAAPKTGWTHD